MPTTERFRRRMFTRYLRVAGKSDDLTKSVHYGEVCHFIRKFAEDHVFKLIETLAETLAMEVLIAFPADREAGFGDQKAVGADQAAA